MNRGEFEQHFSKISESHKRDVSDMTDRGRPKIGKIGIGFIAANELCNVMVLELSVQPPRRHPVVRSDNRMLQLMTM